MVFNSVSFGVHLCHHINLECFLDLLVDDFHPKNVDEKTKNIDFIFYEDVVLSDINLNHKNITIKNNKNILNIKIDEETSIREFITNVNNWEYLSMSFYKAIVIKNKENNQKNERFDLNYDKYNELFNNLTNNSFIGETCILKENYEINGKVFLKGDNICICKLDIGYSHKCTFGISLCTVSLMSNSLSFEIDNEEIKFLLDKTKELENKGRIKNFKLGLFSDCCI